MSPEPTDPTPTDPNPGFVIYPVHPDLLAYARQTFDLEAYMKDLREMQEAGGYPLESFIGEIEAIVRGS